MWPEALLHETEFSGVIVWLEECVMTGGHDAVGDGDGVAGVPEGVGDAHPPPPKMSEKARTVPTSPPAASIAVKVQFPSAFCPSKADNGLFGVKLPVNGPASVSPGH